MMILINKCWWLPLVLSCIWACRPEANPGNHTETAFKPAEVYFAQRLSPQTQFPVEAYHTALRRLGTAVADRSPEPGFDAEWTTRGPINVGARINTIALDPIDTSVIYAGFSAGGIFKTSNGGQNWKPVFDQQAYLAIGDITIHPKNNKIVFAGTGDPNISGYPFIGDGLFRSTDAGNTWQYQGLREGRIISKILIDPLRPDTMYVGCMGLPFERDRNRGMYKTTDGGKTWRQILFVDTQAGIIDAVMDPSNPQVIYAASWDRIRNNQESTVSGDHARIYKTSDGGRSWTVLSRGLPTGPQGRIGLTISPQHPEVLYAVYVGTNSELEGIYKTTDGGQDWERLPIESGPGFQPGALGGFGWYFGKIRVHPQDTGTVYLLGVELHRISDGGLQWRTLPDSFDGDMPHADKHDLVFTDEGKMLLATDGGLFKSKDGGSSWKDIENIPATQFYRVEYNPHEPAYFYGGAQDNGSLAGSQMEWRRMYGGDGFQIRFRPEDPNVYYAEYQNGGIIVSLDKGMTWTGATRGLNGGDRRHWDMPYVLDPFDPAVMYTGTYRIYRSTAGIVPDWSPVSEDLTKGNIFGSTFHTIAALDVSKKVPGLLYAGTNDGRVWRSEDGAFNWTEITKGLPDYYVTAVRPSPDREAAVFVTQSGYKSNAFQPFIHYSKDKGQSWQPVTGDLPPLPVNDLLILPGYDDQVLFAATDGGVYATKDRGEHWARLGGNMPMVAVYSLAWNEEQQQLVAGTYARSVLSYPVDYFLGTTNDIPQPQMGNKWRLFPIPTHDNLWIAGEVSAGGLWEIRQSDGRLMLSGVWEEGPFDVSSLPAGLYFLSFKVNGLLRETRSFIKF